MAVFPGAIPAAGTADPTATLAFAGHTALHNLASDEIRAIATKIGTGSSTPVANTFLGASGTGTSTWKQPNIQTDITGTLPIANGGTGTTTSTGTGANVFDTSPTISSPTLTTPTIASFTNANHNHTNSAGGGKITSAAITSFDTSLTTVSNPYKFFGYLSATANLTGSDQKMPFDAELFDTNSNFDTVTNKGRYTAPVNGFYWFHAQDYIQSLGDGTEMNLSLHKNGSATAVMGGWGVSANSGNDSRAQLSAMLQLTAGDYVELYVQNSMGTRNHLGADAGPLNIRCWFEGFLISQT